MSNDKSQNKPLYYPNEYEPTVSTDISSNIGILFGNYNTNIRTYLCLERESSTNNNQIVGFDCYQYNNNNAKSDDRWYSYLQFISNINSTTTTLLYNKRRHTVLHVCKWVPPIFDKYILDWKLQNKYWLGNNRYF
jgi:hypothetical protein